MGARMAALGLAARGIANQMKSLIGIALLVTVFASPALADSVFVVKYASRADKKVYVVAYASGADCVIWRAPNTSRARGPARWFFVNYASGADVKIFYVKYASQAELRIFFTPYASRAGCK